MIGLGLNTAADTSHPALFAPAGYASTHIAFDGVSEYGQIQAGESFSSNVALWGKYICLG